MTQNNNNCKNCSIKSFWSAFCCCSDFIFQIDFINNLNGQRHASVWTIKATAMENLQIKDNADPSRNDHATEMPLHSQTVPTAVSA